MQLWYSVLIFLTAQLFWSSEKVFEEMVRRCRFALCVLPWWLGQCLACPQVFSKYSVDIFYMFFWSERANSFPFLCLSLRFHVAD